MGGVAAVAACLPAASAQDAAGGESAALVLKADQPGPVINRHLYGQFAEHLGHCIYGGIWVGPDSPIPNTRGIRNDVVAALRELHVPDVRWPGGCFADQYHWRDGIGPRDQRPKLINTTWGGVVEDNSFGTHEFMDFCEQIGTEPYLCGNVGSGTVREMLQWVEYMTSDADSPMANLRRQNGREQPWKVPQMAIGNESWGCGGEMRPEYYADEFRRYNTFVKDYSGNHIYRVACGPSGEDYNWTEVLMAMAGKQMNGLALHYYTLPTGNWHDKGSATEFGEQDWFNTMKRTLEMEDVDHQELGDHGQVRPAEAGRAWWSMSGATGTTWSPEPTPPSSTSRTRCAMRLSPDSTCTSSSMHADRVKMANIAQMVNVLQSMILTDGPKMVRTPTYWVFDMFQVHQDATSLPVQLQTPEYKLGDESMPAVSASASRDKEGKRAPLARQRRSGPRGDRDLHARRSRGEERNRSGAYGVGDERPQHL